MKNKIKKIWLYSLFITSGIYYTLYVIFFIGETGPYNRGINFLVLIGLLLNTFLSYYFVYKKKSLRWLFFQIISIPLIYFFQYLRTIIKLSIDNQWTSFLNIFMASLGYFMGELPVLALLIFYWINSLKLYQKIKREKNV